MVCLAVKLPCCFCNSIQAKKNGEGIKNNAEPRLCLLLECALLGSCTTQGSLQLSLPQGLGETASLLPQPNALLSHIVREHLPQLLHEQQSREREKRTFWKARSVGVALKAAEPVAVLPLR